MAIVKWQDFFAPNPQDINRENYLVFETDRQAEILDWLRCKNISTAEKDRFIHNLINFDDNCGGFYDFRAYFLAAKYIAVFPNSSFVDEIAEQLLDWSRGYFWCSKSKIDFNETISKEAEKALKALKTTGNSKAIAAYEQTIQNTQQDDLLISTAQKLLELDPNNKIAIAIIGSKLHDTDDKAAIFKLIGLCNEHKIATDAAVDRLLNLLGQIKSGDSPDFMAWVSNTFYYLEKLAKGNHQAINSLIQLRERIPPHYPREDIEICELVLTTLGGIGINDETAINALTSFLDTSPPDSLLYLGVKVLWHIDPGNIKAMNIYIRMLETEVDSYYAKDAALIVLENYLTTTGLTEKSAHKAVNVILEHTQTQKYIDAETVAKLAEIGVNSNIAREALFKLLNINQNNWSRVNIANTLLKLNIDSQKALSIIYAILESEENELMLYSMAKILLDTFPDNLVALNTLNKLLAKAKDKYTRLEIAKKLALSDSSNQLAIDTLSELIYIPSLYNRLNEQELALPVLEQIDPSNKLAIKALEEFAKKTKDQDALIYIIKHLQRLDPGNDVAQRRLNDIIAAVISSMQTYDHYDDSSLLNILIYGRGIRSSQLLPEIVISLKPYLNHKGSTNREIACLIIWKCAKQLSYPDFYRAWHT